MNTNNQKACEWLESYLTSNLEPMETNERWLHSEQAQLNEMQASHAKQRKYVVCVESWLDLVEGKLPLVEQKIREYAAWLVKLYEQDEEAIRHQTEKVCELTRMVRESRETVKQFQTAIELFRLQ